EGCVKETRFTHEGLPTNFFRVKVEADGGQSIKNCTAILTSIGKDGKTKWGGDSAKLTFAQGEAPDAFSKTIRSKVPEFFDVLAITSMNEIYPGTYQNPFGRILAIRAYLTRNIFGARRLYTNCCGDRR